MKYVSFVSEYDKFPKLKLKGDFSEAFQGCETISEKLRESFQGIVAFEMYPGVDVAHFQETILKPLNASLMINIETCRKDEKELNHMLHPYLTEDRVFGKMSDFTISDLYDMEKVAEMKQTIQRHKGLVIVYGFGASLVNYHQLVYVDITRWEIQLRYRKGLSSFTANNPNEDILKKFKRGYFVEWRIADRVKQEHYLQSRYLIDANDIQNYKMIATSVFEAGLDQFVSSPFRLVPYFDPGIWGGKWMEEVCNLPKIEKNYAWSFDGVPEENALCLSVGAVDFLFPAINLVFFRPVELLGEKVFARFGKEYPIRFDFLDTMEGGNLSLQVHPLPSYIQKTFGMKYTQDESYYILDAAPGSSVYLGLKPGIDPKEFVFALEKANQGKADFEDQKYINQFPAKKHDHFLIPAGTVHCSGKNTMVLEISSTPYIFTFKLWDWGRLGLDGLPRPVHIHHGKEVIQYDRTTDWVQTNLINRIEPLSDIEERTGLHELEFIETRRFHLDQAITISTHDSFNQLNLVSGQAAIIFSPTGQFSDFEVHYAETFIVPESIREFSIRPKYENEPCMVIQAFVR